MIKNVFVTLIVLLVTTSAHATLNIVTTTSDLASIAQSVGGEYVNVVSLQSGKRDPHFLQAKPSYIMKAKKADLWIRIGMELEIGYEPVILEKSRNPKIMPGQPGHLDCSAVVLVLDKPTGKIDRSMGDVHGMGNPHYWLDPYNGRQLAKAICKQLKHLDGTHQDFYEQQCNSFCNELATKMFGQTLVEAFSEEQLWQEELNGTMDTFLNEKGLSQQLAGWKADMLSLQNRKVATYHRSWIYFLNRFGLTAAIELEPKPGIPPSPGYLVKVIERIKKEKISLLLMEPYYPKAHGQTIKRKTGIPLLIVANASGGESNSKDYISMIDNVVMQLTQSLTKNRK